MGLLQRFKMAVFANKEEVYKNSEAKIGIIICFSREMNVRELNLLQSPAEDRGVERD
jgi:hypothetical protein